MEILNIDCCMRDASRTAVIARAFMDAALERYPGAHVTVRDIAAASPAPMNRERQRRREALLERGELDAPEFALAREFAAADRIVIAAPLWELSFPAALKAYIENVSVAGIAFSYSDDGSTGLCRAEKLAFITSRGADFSSGPLADFEFGASYLAALCRMYGIDGFITVAADGLDAFGADAGAIVGAAKRDAVKKARTF